MELSVLIDAARAFLARRNDGLGERLRALANAMVLAKELRGDFFFVWEPRNAVSETQAIQSAEHTFHPDFLAAHRLTQGDLNRFTLFEFPLEPSDAGVPVGKPVLQIAQQNLNGEQDRILRNTHVNLAHARKRAIRDIEFSEVVSDAMRVAHSIQLPEGAIALHLRAGDVIYGPARFSGVFATKCLPFPIVESLISKGLNDGQAFLLFGEDTGLLQYFQRRYNVQTAHDFGEHQDKTAQALFEMTLMSRCHSIVAGNSGFAHFAAWMGGVTVRNLSSSFSREHARGLIHRRLTSSGLPADISDLQVAHAAWAGIFGYGDRLAANPIETQLLEIASERDPDNKLYSIGKAIKAYSEGSQKVAESVLRAEFRSLPPFESRIKRWLKSLGMTSVRKPYLSRWLDSTGRYSIVWILDLVSKRKMSYLPKEWVEVLEAQAAEGMKMAVFSLWLSKGGLRGTDQSQAFFSQFSRLAGPADKSFLAAMASHAK